MRATADRRDEGDLVAVRDHCVPVHELLVERYAYSVAVSGKARVQPRDSVEHVGHVRPRRKLDAFIVGSGQLAKPSEEPRAHSDRDCHGSMLVRSAPSAQEYVDFLAGVQRSFHGVARALRGAVPERDEHIACVDEALVARSRL